MPESLGFKAAKPLIMAVDDVPVNLKILHGVLAAADYRTTFATRGQQVLERLADVKPDLILLDLMMPEMSGLDVCYRLKQNPETVHIPIIFLTASHEVAHLGQAFDCGAVDYITKPFNTTELLARVRTHLDLSQLRRQAQRQAQWETISRQIVQGIHASINLQDTLNNTVQAIQDLLQASRALVYRWCAPHRYKLLAIAGHIPTSDFYSEDLGCPYLQHNSLTFPKDKDQPSCLAESATCSPQGEGHKFLVTAPQDLHLPIYQHGRLWGGLVVQSACSNHIWAQQEAETLSLIVQQLEISIQHAELHQRLSLANQELKRISNTDGLTQISNRRCFDNRLEQEWRRLQREKQPLALILCDIDYFKQFNDTFGHPSGDRCLVAVAQALQGCLKRPADCVARYGGEEFVVLLPNTELAGAVEVVEQIQSAIAALQIAHPCPTPTSQITLSFGIHLVVPKPLADAADAIDAMALADRALYAAKEAGRNRYRLTSELAS
ncbi:diguanylate cyclase domain-containing protein [Nodosilinea nodulosa]|uniref:diguanylate cyclase domain-containing protein n=1 Tax=Nodosilinea nodulosa TaxID=416001 RepID=UPI0002D2FEED|nr:diguanylate cyclase [Nodosilinea nodulosa]